MSFYMKPAAVLLAALLLLAPTGVPAAELPPAGSYVYAAEHEDYGDIGSFTIDLVHDGGETVATVTVDIEVTVLFITVHSETATRRETWRGGRFVAYESVTDENGDVFRVDAAQLGDALVVEGPSGRVEAPAGVFPTNPWNMSIVEATTVMDTKTGELKQVSVRDAGEDSIEVRGATVPARKFVMTGEVERELWFAPSGILLRFRFDSDGSLVTFTLK